MRQGAVLARLIKPSSWPHATRLTYAPRQCLLRPCALRLSTSQQQRFFQPTSCARDLIPPAQDNQSAENGTKSAEVDGRDAFVPEKQVKDHSWVFANAGDRIDTINGKALRGIEEFVTHQSGTKLLCSWNIVGGNEPTICVPGDPPRVRDMKVPVDLKPEAVQDTLSSDWTLGNPQSSFEPFFASLTSMNPLANFDSTDVIARSSTLHLLLGVTRGNLSQFGLSNVATAFHITLVKDTLLIKRIQNPTKGRSLGRGLTPTLTGSFMNKITEMRVSEENINPDHSQAVRYDLAHLRCVVITPVDAATGNASLPPLKTPDEPPGIPQASGFVNIKRAGRGAPPGSVTKLMTGIMGPETNERRLNYKGELKIKPSGQAKIWFERPTTILQGHFEAASPSASEDTTRLARVSVRAAGPLLDQTENACQLELRRLVTLLERLRSTARRVGGSCILTCLPSQKSESGDAKVPPKFELYKCGPGAEPLVLDWHIQRFWSKP